jgi:hypothetical protein
VKVDVSDTDCKRALGLSGRKLLENHWKATILLMEVFLLLDNS